MKSKYLLLFLVFIYQASASFATEKYKFRTMSPDGGFYYCLLYTSSLNIRGATTFRQRGTSNDDKNKFDVKSGSPLILLDGVEITCLLYTSRLYKGWQKG